MLQNIREIGIFIIAAQAVVHFAPGKQYEKYIRSISGVIILVLFLKPFVQLAGGQWQAPSAVLERLQEAGKLSEISVDPAAADGGVETAVTGRMEKEIADRLNRELAADTCLVKEVELSLKEGTEDSKEDAFYTVRIVMGERPAGREVIAVEEISVGEPETKEDAQEAYRQHFAELLSLEPERVEVRWDGRN